MGKKVLLVTGSDYTDRVYQAFEDVKKLGHQIYLLSDGCFEPRSGIFEKHFTCDLRKTKEVLEYMEAQPYHFDAVTIKTSEWLTPLTALLAKQYGCIGNDPLVAFNCRSKYHMRQQLAKGGVPIPAFQLCRNYDELQQGILSIGLPCVAKPVGGNASYGTFILRSKEDLDTLEAQYNHSIAYLKKKAIDEDVFAFSDEEMDLMEVHEKVNMVTDYLVEEFMDGPEISVDAIVQRGRVTIFGIEDQIRMAPPYVLQIAARIPYQCSPDRAKEIYDLICHTVEAMQITDSATHTEIIFTPQGPKVVEIGCRIGGDDVHDTIYEVTGYNLMYEAIMTALGEQREYAVENKCHTMMKFLFAEKEGILKEVKIDKKSYDDPNFLGLTTCVDVGNFIGAPPEDYDYIGYISAKGDTPEKAEENLNTFVDNISIIIA